MNKFLNIHWTYLYYTLNNFKYILNIFVIYTEQNFKNTLNISVMYVEQSLNCAQNFKNIFFMKPWRKYKVLNFFVTKDENKNEKG